MTDDTDEPEFQTALELRESVDGGNSPSVDVIEVDEGPDPELYADVLAKQRRSPRQLLVDHVDDDYRGP
jgi:hypothetical protein